MSNPARLYAAARCCVAFVGALGVFLPSIHSQTAPAPAATKRMPTPAQLKQYDKNGNGVLDADEQATFEATEKTDALVMNPFRVSTEKDSGYAAGNTLSGGRINTPLEVNPSSIQVITKEFMDDFAITDFNDAAKWTMNVEVPEGNDAPFGGSRFEFNVRGAGGSGNYPIRDGFPQYFVPDGYNTERFEIVGGPNSGMAGVGGAGGMVGSSSKRARFNNRSTTVSTRGDNFGGHRETLDFNYGVDRFGFRGNILYQDTKSIQTGTSKKQTAFTFRGEYKLTDRTIVSAQFERSGEWNTQYRTTYGDQQSFWNRTTVNLDNSALVTTGTGLSQISATNDRLTYNFSTQSVLNYVGNQYQTNGINYQIPWNGNPNVPQDWYGGANMIKSFGKTFWLGPVDNFADRDNNTRSVSIEHRFSSDLTALVGWQSSDIDPVTYWGDFSQPSDVRVDVNRLLPNGANNPNYLRQYSEWGAGGSQYQQNGNDDYLAQVNYRFAVPRWFDFKQSFTAIFTYKTGQYEAWARTWRRNNNPAQLNPLNGVNSLTLRTYYGDPLPHLQPLIQQAALNALIPGTTWANTDGTGFFALSKRGGRNGAIYSTTSFLQDRLVISGNWRRDKVLNSDMNGITIAGNSNDPLNGYKRYIGAVNPATGLAEVGYSVPFSVSMDSYSYGGVVTPFPASWAREGSGSLVQRWLSPIKLAFSHAENNTVPPSGGPFYTGERPSAPFSQTTDYALRYSVPGGKVYFEFRRYFTQNLGNLIGMPNAADIQTIYRNLGYTSGSNTYDFNSNSYRDTSDRDLTGSEVTLTANPTRNWTLTANYARPRVQTVNERPYLRRYLAEHRAEFDAGAALADGTTVPGSTRVILSQSAIVTALQAIDNGLNGLTSGTIGNGPLQRGSIATSYHFREGMLKGVGVSGGLTWRGQAKVGSRDPRLKFQTTAPTVTQTAAAAYDYLYVPSTMTNNVGVNYTRRFGKYNARFQLNVTNLLNNDDPQWGGTDRVGSAYSVINAGQLTNQSDGNALTVAGSNPRMQVLSTFAQYEPRKFTLTTTVSF
jgi:TonB-dependent Receptor Plug Domain